MVNYQNGKIYAIRSSQTDEFYIGSTTKQYLSQRMVGHRNKMRFYKNTNDTKDNMTSFKILQYDDAYIELIEAYPCNSKDELCSREGHHIRENKDLCCNRKIEGRTQAEYYVDHKEHLKAKSRANHHANKERVSAKAKVWRTNNKEHKAQKDKEYREANSTTIKARNSERIICECGKEVCRGALTRHKRTVLHKFWDTNYDLVHS